jgi:hypothetical protein
MRFIELGAQTEVVLLAEHPTLPLSPRAMAQRHIERQYANDWQLPDDVHFQAVGRLQAWLDTQCSEPDRAIAATNQFKDIAAHW